MNLLVAALLGVVCSLAYSAAQNVNNVNQVKLCDYQDYSCPTVSRIGLGTLHIGDVIGGIFNPVKINEWLRTGLANGITLLDTSDVYPVKGGVSGTSAELIGKAMRLTPGLREKFVIVSKIDIIFPSTIDTSYAYLEEKVHWFLGALQTSYLDILLLHYPNSFMNATEVSQLFVDLKASGKVRHFGVSNHYPSHMELLQTKLSQVSNNKIRLVTNEIEISVWNPSYLNYDQSLVDDAYKNGYHNLAWSSLAGNPTGGFNRLFQLQGARQTKILKAVNDVGTQLNITDAPKLSLAWVLSHPSGIIPLIGTTKVDRVNSLTSNILDLTKRITTAQWWTIGKAGGLCPLAVTECDYAKYHGFD